MLGAHLGKKSICLLLTYGKSKLQPNKLSGRYPGFCCRTKSSCDTWGCTHWRGQGASCVCLELEHATFHFKLLHLEGSSSLTMYSWAELLPSSTTQNRSSYVSISKISRKDHIPDWKASRADILSIPYVD